jgi:hypothetical protein
MVAWRIDLTSVRRLNEGELTVFSTIAASAMSFCMVLATSSMSGSSACMSSCNCMKTAGADGILT